MWWRCATTSERRPEHLGRIELLEDTDGDGRYDKATVFLADLPWPTAVTCWDGGVFIGATPDILYAKDTNGDGVADIREVVFTGFASDYAPYATNKLNVQALLNSFQWGLDDRIHGATSMSGGKVRLVDSEFTRGWRERAIPGGSNPGSDPLPTNAVKPARPGLRLRPAHAGAARRNRRRPARHELRREHGPRGRLLQFGPSPVGCLRRGGRAVQSLPRTFHPPGPAAADGPSAEVFRRSPDEPWRVLRTGLAGRGLGRWPGRGRWPPHGYFTGATGVTLYRGDAYGPDFAGDAFIGDAGSNLVHRKKLRPAPDGVLLVGERAADERQSEFLASTDNWFRPVQFYNGPDGCLWVVDMYRETIEHPVALACRQDLKKNLDLDSGRERGRLWRLQPEELLRRRVRASILPALTTPRRSRCWPIRTAGIATPGRDC
jgi:hypothetical protein